MNSIEDSNRVANSVNPDQNTSDLGLHFLFVPLCHKAEPPALYMEAEKNHSKTKHIFFIV